MPSHRHAMAQNDTSCPLIDTLFVTRFSATIRGQRRKDQGDALRRKPLPIDKLDRSPDVVRIDPCYLAGFKPSRQQIKQTGGCALVATGRVEVADKNPFDTIGKPVPSEFLNLSFGHPLPVVWIGLTKHLIEAATNKVSRGK